MTTPDTIRIPVYTYGKYEAMDGTVEDFTEPLMRQLVKNTNYIINRKVFIPTVGYDHPVTGNKDTDAHGHIKAAVFEDGVVSLDVLPIPDREGRVRLVEDRKTGRRPHVSGEHKKDFSFVDERGKTEFVGPTILGLAALGKIRPGIKNPKTTQVSDIEFPESVSGADAFAAREALRKGGVIAQTFSEGVLVFSEVQLPKIDEEPPKEQPMTAEEKAEFQRMLNEQAATLKAGFDAQIAAVKTESDAKIVAMSEGAEKNRKIKERVAIIVAEKKLSKIPAAALEEAALNPSTDLVLAFGEKLSATVLPGAPKGKGDGHGKDADDEDVLEFGEEPKPLAILRPKHFKDPDKFGTELAASVVSFAEAHPKKFAKVRDKPYPEQLKAVEQHIIEREAAAN
jgi:hypothetical protein